jgi:hypothetical protein
MLMLLRLRALLFATRLINSHHGAALLILAGLAIGVVGLAIFGAWSIVTDPQPWKFLIGAAAAIAWLVRHP